MNAVLQPRIDRREHLYQFLRPDRNADPNRRWLAKILASWLNGQSVLPDYLGLEPAQFASMRATYFPDSAIPVQASSGIKADYSRMLEKEDLIQLLDRFRKNQTPTTEWFVSLIVSACLGNDHLWQDLGLWERSELSALLAHNFPALAERNSKDMKWKKFLYKQLCEAEGLYLCRAPSCEVCSDYANCFGPED